jgi:hypothetical protein
LNHFLAVHGFTYDEEREIENKYPFITEWHDFSTEDELKCDVFTEGDGEPLPDVIGTGVVLDLDVYAPDQEMKLVSSTR